MNPKPDAIQFARALRQADNDAEALMWLELKAKQLGGYKFVRHFPIGPYFADFLCRSERLVVEIDGSQHSESQHDERRDQFMAAQSYSIMRFWNTDVYRECFKVKQDAPNLVHVSFHGSTTNSPASSSPQPPPSPFPATAHP